LPVCARARASNAARRLLRATHPSCAAPACPSSPRPAQSRPRTRRAGCRERGRGQASSGRRRNAAKGSTRAAAARRKVERRSPRVRRQAGGPQRRARPPTQSVGCAATHRFRRAPMAPTAIMYRFFAPVLSAQFMLRGRGGGGRGRRWPAPASRRGTCRLSPRLLPCHNARAKRGSGKLTPRPRAAPSKCGTAEGGEAARRRQWAACEARRAGARPGGTRREGEHASQHTEASEWAAGETAQN
jgi:hypothetical protein